MFLYFLRLSSDQWALSSVTVRIFYLFRCHPGSPIRRLINSNDVEVTTRHKLPKTFSFHWSPHFRLSSHGKKTHLQVKIGLLHLPQWCCQCDSSLLRWDSSPNCPDWPRCWRGHRSAHSQQPAAADRCGPGGHRCRWRWDGSSTSTHTQRHTPALILGTFLWTSFFPLFLLQAAQWRHSTAFRTSWREDQSPSSPWITLLNGGEC